MSRSLPRSPTTPPPAGPLGLIETAQQRISREPDFVVCHRVTDHAGRLHTDPLTFGSLSADVARLCAALDDHRIAEGERVVVATEEPHAFLAWFLALASTGRLAVPLPAPSRLATGSAYAQRIGSVWRDCFPAAVVTDQPERWRDRTGPETASVPILSARPADHTPPLYVALAAPAPPRNATAFLQYTSGSTSQPKGVRITHGNLAANIHALGTRAGFGRHDTMLSWLPLHHDMGLLSGLLVPLYWGMRTYVMSTSAFATRPDSWLQAISQFRATVSVAPPSAYRLVQQHLPDAVLESLDLRCWRLGFCGAEPIDPTLPDDFSSRFEIAGLPITTLYPVYGLAEATVAAAFPPPGRYCRVDQVDRTYLTITGQARPASPGTPYTSFVSVGSALPDHQVCIRPPQAGHGEGVQEYPDQTCPERTIGEITLSGPSISPGYYGRPDHPADQPLRTGDLGYLADGELYVVDRIKDLIIVGGINLFPADIEAHLAPFVDAKHARVAAFPVTTDEGTEGLAIAVETTKPVRAAQPDLATRIARTVLAHFHVTPAAVVLVDRGTLPRTTSGKLQRHQCRRDFESGHLTHRPS